MICANCGTELSDEAQRCWKCGQIQPNYQVFCPTCGRSTPANTLKCQWCGALLSGSNASSTSDGDSRTGAWNRVAREAAKLAGAAVLTLMTLWLISTSKGGLRLGDWTVTAPGWLLLLSFLLFRIGIDLVFMLLKSDFLSAYDFFNLAWFKRRGLDSAITEQDLIKDEERQEQESDSSTALHDEVLREITDITGKTTSSLNG